MRSLTIALAFAVAMISTIGFVRADDAPAAQTLKGTMVCGKCFLKVTDNCQNVLQVQDGDKTVNYFLVDNDISKAAHKNVCHKEIKDVSVTGTVEEKDGKQWITATKIEGVDTDPKSKG